MSFASQGFIVVKGIVGSRTQEVDDRHGLAIQRGLPAIWKLHFWPIIAWGTAVGGGWPVDGCASL